MWYVGYGERNRRLVRLNAKIEGSIDSKKIPVTQFTVEDRSTSERQFGGEQYYTHMLCAEKCNTNMLLNMIFPRSRSCRSSQRLRTKSELGRRNEGTFKALTR